MSLFSLNHDVTESTLSFQTFQILSGGLILAVGAALSEFFKSFWKEYHGDLHTTVSWGMFVLFVLTFAVLFNGWWHATELKRTQTQTKEGS